jgi:hypothetical protein
MLASEFYTKCRANVRFSRQGLRTLLTSGIWSCVVSQIVTDVSEELATLVPHYTALHPRATGRLIINTSWGNGMVNGKLALSVYLVLSSRIRFSNLRSQSFLRKLPGSNVAVFLKVCESLCSVTKLAYLPVVLPWN